MKKNLLSSLIVVVCLVVAVSLFLAGCKTTTTETTAAETTAVVTTAAETTAVATTSGEKVEINYMTWRTGVEGFDTALVSAFEAKNPNIKVNFQGITGVEEYVQAQKTRLLTPGVLDVMSIRAETIEDYVKAGYLADLTGQTFLSNVIDAGLKKGTIDGKTYAVGSSVNLVGVWYNKDAFDKAKISIPKNWEEFISACDKFLDSGYKEVLANGGLDVWPMEFDIYPFMNKLIIEDPLIFQKVKSGEIKYTDPIFVDTFKAIDEFYKKGYVSKDVLSIGYTDSVNFFLNNKIPMQIEGEWYGSAIKSALGDAQPSFNIGVFPMPNPGIDDTIVSADIGIYEAVIESSTHKAEAMKFMEFLCSTEGSQIIADYMGGFTPVKGVQVSDSLAKLFQPLLDYKSVPFWYSGEMSTNAINEFSKGLQDLFAKKITPEQLAERVQTAEESGK